MEAQKPWKAKQSLTIKQQTTAGCVSSPDFKLYNRATAVKSAWYWDKNRHSHH